MANSLCWFLGPNLGVLSLAKLLNAKCQATTNRINLHCSSTYLCHAGQSWTSHTRPVIFHKKKKKINKTPLWAWRLFIFFCIFFFLYFFFKCPCPLKTKINKSVIPWCATCSLLIRVKKRERELGSRARFCRLTWITVKSKIDARKTLPMHIWTVCK